MTNINDLTYGEIKQLLKDFSAGDIGRGPNKEGIQHYVGKKVIIRTRSAGVFYGKVLIKEGSEVLLEDARMLYYWVTKDGGLSLSEIANDGVAENSRICAKTKIPICLEVVNILGCTDQAIASLDAHPNHKHKDE